MQHPRIMIASIGVAVLAAAGGVTAAATSSSTASAAPAASPSHSASATTVRTARVPVNGKFETILVSFTGQPLYYYQPDTATKSFVTGGLAQAWPPLTSTTTPGGTGLSGPLKVLNDVNGQQVTYNGHPLYTFVSDHGGVVTGQGVQNFFVATPGLAPLTSNAAPSSPMAPAAPAAPAGGYGY
jgi:predicted lipoprotein with Yx(FWY)xxD motif